MPKEIKTTATVSLTKRKKLRVFVAMVLAVIAAAYAWRAYELKFAVLQLWSEGATTTSWKANSNGKLWDKGAVPTTILPLLLITPRFIGIDRNVTDPDRVARAIAKLSADEIYLSPGEGTVQSELLRGLADYGRVRVLDLNGTVIDSEGWRQIGRMRNLRRLILDQSNITAEYAECLRNKPALEELTLDETKVDDRLIDILISLKTLKKLNITQTAITSAGFETLRKAHPFTEIKGEPR